MNKINIEAIRARREAARVLVETMTMEDWNMHDIFTVAKSSEDIPALLDAFDAETTAKNDAIENLSLNIKAAFESRDHWRARAEKAESLLRLLSEYVTHNPNYKGGEWDIETITIDVAGFLEELSILSVRAKALEVAVKSDLINYGEDFYPPVCRACIHHGSEQKHLTCGSLCGDEYKNWQFDQDRFTGGDTDAST
ncbi:MAG: hypothetical protein FWB91_07960 [Defluviitaleaceae bacterium]|nr:hypothetical protein [Defluviitaleaceae bacterium]